MQTLCEKAASDIKDCANACDSYSKKRLVVKVLKGHTWETKLVGFVSTFTTRKADFQQALAIHTARTVDAIQTMVQGIDAKYVFDIFSPPSCRLTVMCQDGALLQSLRSQCTSK